MERKTPQIPSSSLFRDISNFKTPLKSRPPSDLHTCPHPSGSLRRPSSMANTAKSTHLRRSRLLKALELEQSQSCRKELLKKHKSMRSLSTSLSAWLNFLFENPNHCGCRNTAESDTVMEIKVSKRDSLVRRRDQEAEEDVTLYGLPRWPKRQRDGDWNSSAGGDGSGVSTSMFGDLQRSLEHICSFDDLKGRMREYLSLSDCNHIFDIMTRVAKNIDQGRLKMRPHCPIVTDLGFKEKALKVLLSYNSAWLRVGLYIIFDGESLLMDGAVSATDEEIGFLKVVIEKQLLSHPGLAKSFAFNKRVEGLYKPGYFELLGSVILKRFLLLVLILDTAKSHSSLPLNYGLDGQDGGSPLLFNVHSNIKSSQQMITNFLMTDVMHGEGNLLAHLVMIGYKLSYEQLPLFEYYFAIEDLFPDIQDGVKLCRAIQLLQNDSSILMKLMIPADSCKKRLANCNTALQYLKKAGVPLHDDDGTLITGDDIMNGDKELTLSLLWNMFVHLQIPLLINKTILYDEICKICKDNSDPKNMDSSSPLDMLFNWIKAICENYDKEERLNSIVDGKAMWCLLDFYFHKELTCACSIKDMGENEAEESIVSSVDTSDALHNFVLSQRITTLLGNVPQVLQTSDILEYNGPCNNKSVIVLLVFLSSQLLVKKSKDQLNFHKLRGCCCQALGRRRSSLDKLSKKSEAKLVKDEDSLETIADAARKFKAVKAWWQDMAKKNSKGIIEPVPAFSLHFSINKHDSKISREKAAIVIQSHARKLTKRQHYLKIRNAVSCLQVYFSAWLTMKHGTGYSDYKTRKKQAEKLARTVDFMVDRHNFVKLKRSALLIQSAARLMCLRVQIAASSSSSSAKVALENSLVQMNSLEEDSTVTCDKKTEGDCIQPGPNNQLDEFGFVVFQPQQESAATIIQRHFRGWLGRKYLEYECNKSRLDSQLDKKEGLVCQSQQRKELAAAVVIQRHFRCWMARKHHEQIQTGLDNQVREKEFLDCQSQQNEESSATVIQRYYRGWIGRKHLQNEKHAVITIQKVLRCLSLWRKINIDKVATRSAIVIQSCLRGWLARKDASRRRHCVVVIQSNIRCWLARRMFLSKKMAAIIIQSALRSLLCSQRFSAYTQAAIEIQRFARGRITRCRLLGSTRMQSRTEAAIIKLQRWCRRTKILKSRTKAAIVIQSHFRGQIARRRAAREKCLIVLIQSNWKGYIARRDAKGQLVDLRHRVQKSAANVDDGMRLINKHIAALNELRSMKSLSNILRNCATLDKATSLSKNCCEVLVEDGAIDILLKQMKSVSRSIPDQEILKHILSILRNLARYPHLADSLINHRGSVETILWELLRNKEEGFFIACDLLKKMCMRRKGFEAMHRSPFLLKRLRALVDELSRKATKVKRINNHRDDTRDGIERRQQEALEILNMIVRRGDYLEA